MTNYRSLNHSKWACQYHVVFIPKYRKKAQDLLRDRQGEFARLAWSRTVLQAVHPVLKVAATPLVDALCAHPHGSSDVVDGYLAHREE